MEPPAADSSSDEGSSSLDHALLESLFYNEMMMIDDNTSLLSSGLLSTLTTPSTAPAEHSALSAPEDTTHVPPLFGTTAQYAERAMLNDFGALEAPESSHHSHQPPTMLHDATTSQQQPSAMAYPPTTNVPNPILQSQSLSMQATSAASATSGLASLSQEHKNLPPPRPSSPAQHGDANDKRQKLVSQFATLATRLGITLPSQVVESLTSMDHTLTTSSEEDENIVATRKDPPPKAVQQLESTASAAIAAVVDTRNKKRESSANKQQYGKRKKKPRLAECESKLAQLKAENELLKRHLQTISNQNHKLDTERHEQEQRMRRMIENGADPEEMNDALQKYSEYYSDYGRRRHQELSFHLEQLQRLASPTNFTKMGLWTMGQQSKDPKRNPIAGILQKELGITPQQGRKILEQRQKIQKVCANLKECVDLLSKLKALCEQKTKIFHDRMTKCREILTPRQVIKLLIWIDEHSNMLEKVCPGWGSEQITAKKSG